MHGAGALNSDFLICSFAALGAVSAATSLATSGRTDPAEIHRSAIVIDTHADTPQRLLDEGFDLGTDTPVEQGHFGLGKVRRGNLAAQFFSIWVDPRLHQGHFAHRAMLGAVAKNGGVVMVNYFPAFVDEDFRKAFEAQSKEREAALDALRDHIAKAAGIDHVGLGSDFDGVSSLPQGIDSVADLPKITVALAARGYSRDQLHKILGTNLLRVFKECERISRKLSEKPG